MEVSFYSSIARNTHHLTMTESFSAVNKRIKSHDEEDRISELPDSIIQHILSLLPSTKEAIRTGILSKRWRNQWTRVRVLIFKPPPNSGEEYYRFIESALILHDCPKLKKFHLEYDYDSVEDPRFTLKVRFAIRKCVEELILICRCSTGSYLLPVSLFDNALLVRLATENCYFMTDWSVNWPSLKSLKMDCYLVNENNHKCSQGIANIVSGSPLLEFFEFQGPMEDHISIVSKSLKVLWFVDVHLPASFMVLCTNLVELKVVISENWDESIYPDQMMENVLSGCPNIHSLKLDHFCGFDKLVIASKSLRVLHLQDIRYTTIEVSCPNLEKLDILYWERVTFKEFNIPSSVCATLDDIYILSDDDWELLVQLRHANNLNINSSFFEIMLDSDLEDRLSLPLVNSKFLTLNVDGNFGSALPGIAYALHLPKLETLVIKLNSKSHKFLKFGLLEDLQDFIISIFDDWNSNGSTGLTCLVSHLKTVKILGMYERDDECKFVLEFIEFLLKNARVLEKLIVSLERSRTDFVVEVSQKLLSFPRYSQSVNIELLCSTFHVSCRNC